MESETEIAVFGGGCFWCTEAVFKLLKGVVSIAPGYAGGKTDNPSYDSVSMGNTGHAEVIKVEFNPSEITYKNLLTVFFAAHDPTTLNRQGPDSGTQYRSIILYTSDAQKKDAEEYITELTASDPGGKPIVTEVVPLTKFYDAEAYHFDYAANNPDQPYIQIVSTPKVLKVQKLFDELLKTHAKQ